MKMHGKCFSGIHIVGSSPMLPGSCNVLRTSLIALWEKARACVKIQVYNQSFFDTYKTKRDRAVIFDICASQSTYSTSSRNSVHWVSIAKNLLVS